MTPASLRALIERLGISQIETARLIGVDPSTIRRYLSGRLTVPEPTTRLLYAIEDIPGMREYLRLGTRYT